MSSKLIRGLAVVICCSSTAVMANNVSGVFSPVIKEGDRSYQFRAATSPGENGGNDVTAIRGHYQQAIGTDLRWRIIGQVRDVDGSYEFDNARAELLWYFKRSDSDNWDSGMRFDLRTRKGERPENIAVHWTNQWSLSNNWSARAITSLNWFFGGANPPSGTFFEARSRIAYKTESGISVGVDTFNSFGKIGEFGNFNEQSHQAGPFVSGKMADVSYLVGYLAGVSDGARDDTFRLWLGKSF